MDSPRRFIYHSAAKHDYDLSDAQMAAITPESTMAYTNPKFAANKPMRRYELSHVVALATAVHGHGNLHKTPKPGRSDRSPAKVPVDPELQALRAANASLKEALEVQRLRKENADLQASLDLASGNALATGAGVKWEVKREDR